MILTFMQKPLVILPLLIIGLANIAVADQPNRTGYFGKWHAKMPKGYHKEDPP